MAISNTPNKTEIQKTYSQLVDAGYELIQLHQAFTVSQGGKRLGKAPVASKWTTTDPLTLDEAISLRLQGYNIGNRLTAETVVIDIDPKNAPDGVELLEALVAEFPSLEPLLVKAPCVLTGSRSMTDEPGRHYYFHVTLPESEGRIRNGLPHLPGIEFKSLGRQVVASLSQHPDTELLYEWDKKPKFPAPELPTDVFEKIWLPKGGQTTLTDGEAILSPEQLEGVLSRLDVLQFDSNETWEPMMFACHDATGGAGFDEFVAWSTSDPCFADRAHEIQSRWDSLDASKTGNVTWKTLEKICRDHGVEGNLFGVEADEFTGTDGDETADLAIPPSLMKQMSEQYMLINDNGKVRVFSEDYITTLGRKLWQQMSLYDFRAFHNDTLVEMPNEKKPIPAGDAWLGWSGKQKYRGLSFEPEHPPGPLPDGKFNMWTGFSVQPSGKGDWSMLEELILVALADGNEDHRDYILDWMARSVQFPHLPGSVAVAFRGGKGTGKGTLGRAWTKIFGRHGLPISSQGLLTGRFNNHLKDTVALFADEAVWGGDKAGESVFKALITEPILAYEAKGKDIEQGRNCIHIMAASNADWAVPAGADNERRYAVFNVAGSHVVKPGQEGWKMRDWYTKLNEQLDKGGLAGFLSDLQQRDISRFDPFNDRPQTKGLAEQILRGLSTTHEHVLIYGILNGSLPEDTGGQVEQDGRLIVPKKHFIELMVRTKREHSFLNHSPANQTVKWFFEELFNRSGIRIDEQRVIVHGNQERSWIFPELAACRQLVAKYLGYSIEDLPANSVAVWSDKAEPSLAESDYGMCS